MGEQTQLFNPRSYSYMCPPNVLILTLSTLDYDFHTLYLKSACQNLHYIYCFNGFSEELINHEYIDKEILETIC